VFTPGGEQRVEVKNVPQDRHEVAPDADSRTGRADVEHGVLRGREERPLLVQRCRAGVDSTNQLFAIEKLIKFKILTFMMH
jgi:hypothetical protein